MSILGDSIEIAAKSCVDSYNNHIAETKLDVTRGIGIPGNHPVMMCIDRLSELARSGRTTAELGEGMKIAESVKQWCCAKWQATGTTIPTHPGGEPVWISSPTNVCSDFARAMLPPTHLTAFFCTSISVESRASVVTHRVLRECLVFAWLWVIATWNAHNERDHETREVIDEKRIQTGLPSIDTCAHFTDESTEALTELLVDRLVPGMDYNNPTLARMIRGIETDRGLRAARDDTHST